MKAVSKATKLISLDNSLLSANTERNNNKDSFLYFKIDKEMQKVLLQEIIFIESSKEFVKIHLESGKSLLVKQSISSMQKLLSPHRFLRVHRFYIVTIERISAYNSTHITMGNQKIPIGRLHKNEVENVLKGCML